MREEIRVCLVCGRDQVSAALCVFTMFGGHGRVWIKMVNWPPFEAKVGISLPNRVAPGLYSLSLSRSLL